MCVFFTFVLFFFIVILGYSVKLWESVISAAPDPDELKSSALQKVGVIVAQLCTGLGYRCGLINQRVLHDE